ncbi:putative M1 family aminopeptidase 1 [Toxocara canis]|uniref:Putative M1 family aminopeptidase 1 n=1 Tax=Toxocara canis TaxID=6265 RepID=A0A0B2V3P2_TOXCA|nr:putative M1 family aminopeptidase 1 [Toxocara canis]
MGELVGPQLCIAIIFVVICAHVAYTAVDLFDSYFRLPPHFIPIVYDLKLSLSSKKESICGQVRIEMQCIQSTSEVLLHANPLFVKVQHAIIENRLTNETVDLGMPAVDWNRYLVAFNSSIVFDHAAVYYLSIWFQTTYADSHGGLIKYEDKERGVWASTLFEPTNARRLFPCFDEPRWRSIFKLQLWLEDDFASARYVALSNTAGTYKHWNERLTIWGFDPTPPIPTYLLAITLGQFVSICSAENFDSEICIWRFAKVEGWNETAHRIIRTMAEFQICFNLLFLISMLYLIDVDFAVRRLVFLRCCMIFSRSSEPRTKSDFVSFEVRTKES